MQFRPTPIRASMRHYKSMRELEVMEYRYQAECGDVHTRVASEAEQSHYAQGLAQMSNKSLSIGGGYYI